MKMFRTAALGSALIAAAFTGAQASAATVVSSVNLSSATNASNFSLAGFNTSIGTLTSVMLSITGSLTATGNYTALPPGQDFGGPGYPIQIFVANPSSIITFADPIGTIAVPYPLTGQFSEFFFGQFASVTGTGSAVPSYVSSLALDAFSRSVVSFTASNPASVSWFAATGGFGSLQTTSKDLQLAATYSYTPTIVVTPAVPEPATWGMMILGLGAIGFAMRRGRGRGVRTPVSFA